MLHPSLHLTLQPTRAAAQFDGLRELTVFDELIKPLIRHIGVVGNECHIDELVVEQAAIVILSCHDDGLHNGMLRGMEICRNG